MLYSEFDKLSFGVYNLYPGPYTCMLLYDREHGKRLCFTHCIIPIDDTIKCGDYIEGIARMVPMVITEPKPKYNLGENVKIDGKLKVETIDYVDDKIVYGFKVDESAVKPVSDAGNLYMPQCYDNVERTSWDAPKYTYFNKEEHIKVIKENSTESSFGVREFALQLMYKFICKNEKSNSTYVLCGINTYHWLSNTLYALGYPTGGFFIVKNTRIVCTPFIDTNEIIYGYVDVNFSNTPPTLIPNVCESHVKAMLPYTLPVADKFEDIDHVKWLIDMANNNWMLNPISNQYSIEQLGKLFKGDNKLNTKFIICGDNLYKCFNSILTYVTRPTINCVGIYCCNMLQPFDVLYGSFDNIKELHIIHDVKSGELLNMVHYGSIRRI